MSQGSQNENVVITDTSCFTLLDKIDAFPILNSLYQHIITTPEIAKEFGKVLPNWITIQNVVNRNLLYVYSEKVDLGEASAIALAMEVSSPLLVLDDLKGRKISCSIKSQLHGNVRHTYFGKTERYYPIT